MEFTEIKECLENYKKYIILHHNDADGRLSSILIRYALASRNDVEIISHELSYGDIDYDELIDEDACIFVLDYTLPLDVYKKYSKKTDIVIIDHHESSAKLYENIDYIGEIVVEPSTLASACGILIAILEEIDYVFKDAVSTICKIINLFDSQGYKTMKNGERALYLNEVLKSYSEDELLTLFKFITKSDVESMIDIGGTIYLTNQKTYKMLRIQNAFDSSLEVDGETYTVRAFNFPLKGMEVFGEDLDKYDICSIFFKTSKGFEYSIYSKNKKLDMGTIASKFGGGGHKDAAGFILKKLIYKELKGE